MWFLVLFFFGAAPAWAEDLGELSANPAGISGLFGFFGLSGFFDTPARFSGPANKTDQIDQINEIDQYRLSLRPRPPN